MSELQVLHKVVIKVMIWKIVLKSIPVFLQLYIDDNDAFGEWMDGTPGDSIRIVVLIASSDNLFLSPPI